MSQVFQRERDSACAVAPIFFVLSYTDPFYGCSFSFLSVALAAGQPGIRPGKYARVTRRSSRARCTDLFAIIAFCLEFFFFFFNKITSIRETQTYRTYDKLDKGISGFRTR